MDGFGTLSPAADLEDDLMRRYVLPPNAGGGPAPMPRGLMPPDMVPPGESRLSPMPPGAMPPDMVPPGRTRLSPMPPESAPPDLQPINWSQMNRPFGTLSDPRGAVIAGAGKPWELWAWGWASLAAALVAHRRQGLSKGCSRRVAGRPHKRLVLR